MGGWPSNVDVIGVTCVSCCTLLAYLISIVWTCRSSGRGHLLTAFGSTPVAVRTQLTAKWICCSLRRVSNDDSNSNSCALAKSQVFEGKRLDLARRAVFRAAPGIALMIAISVGLSAVTWDSREDDPNCIAPIHAHMINGCVYVTIAMFALVSENQPTIRTCMIAELLIMSRLTWLVFNYPSGAVLLLDRQLVFGIRFAACFTPTDIRLTVCLNLMYSLASSYAMALHLSEEPLLTKLLVNDPLVHFIFSEVMSTTFVLIARWVLLEQLRKEAHALVEAKAALKFRSAVSRLLTTIYDVVIELDANFRFVEASDALAGMLLHGYRRSLRGMYLQELLASADDRARFNEHMANDMDCPTSVCMAMPIRLGLQDGDGSVVHVEMLTVRFEKPNGEEHHLIGIRELDFDAQPEMPSPSSAFKHLAQQPGSNKPRLTDDISLASAAEHATKRTPSATSSANLLNSDFFETPIASRRRSLAKCLLSWNIQLSRLRCCSYHMLLREGSHVLKSLTNCSCHDWCKYQKDSQQCTVCGLLCEQDEDTLDSPFVCEDCDVKIESALRQCSL